MRDDEIKSTYGDGVGEDRGTGQPDARPVTEGATVPMRLEPGRAPRLIREEGLVEKRLGVRQTYEEPMPHGGDRT